MRTIRKRKDLEDTTEDFSYANAYTTPQKKIPKKTNYKPIDIEEINLFEVDEKAEEILLQEEIILRDDSKTIRCGICTGRWQSNHNERLEKLNG